MGVGMLGTAGTLLALVTFGGGFVYAGQLLPAPSRERMLDITATLTDRGTVLLPPDRRACLARFGLLLADDAFLVYSGPVVNGSCADPTAATAVERTIEMVINGEPVIGQEIPARFDEYVFSVDPADVGVDFTEIAVPLDGLPSAPAWLVQGNDDYVIMVHGRSATRAETLRVLPRVAEQGYSIMAITYRNDMAGAPNTEDSIGRFGQTEWQDLAAAVGVARQRGASRIVLMGFSQGGSLIGYYLRNLGEDDIDGVVLDSPLLSLSSTLVQQARRRGIPAPLVPPILLGTRIVAGVRAGLDIADVEHVDTLATTTVPLLLIHGDADDFVPVGATDELASRRPDNLTYQRIPGAGHVEGWNTDQARYLDAVQQFLSQVLN